MKDTFVGTNNHIFFEGEHLNPHLEEVNHSPTGFSWGYGGSGPAQAAYAILREYYLNISRGDTEMAVDFAKRHYQQFKWDIVAKLSMFHDWKLTIDQITDWTKEKMDVR
jgi:hypothetical protein